jgi:hypothetical protein
MLGMVIWIGFEPPFVAALVVGWLTTVLGLVAGALLTPPVAGVPVPGVVEPPPLGGLPPPAELGREPELVFAGGADSVLLGAGVVGSVLVDAALVGGGGGAVELEGGDEEVLCTLLPAGALLSLLFPDVIMTKTTAPITMASVAGTT